MSIAVSDPKAMAALNAVSQLATHTRVIDAEGRGTVRVRAAPLPLALPLALRERDSFSARGRLHSNPFAAAITGSRVAP